uniref:Uncharacterized protein n=1 Tax=Opuntia streptacantha TaxID=393608 RepID=A0A7C9E834_OPUST
MTGRKKKKEPPDPSRLVLLLQSVNFIRLIASGLDRSGVLSPDFVLDCYSLRSYSICAKIQWLFRSSRVLLLTPSFTFVNGSIVHFGSGGVTLGSLSGAVRVAAAANFQSPPVTAHLHVSEQPRGAAFGSHLDWSCKTPRVRSLVDLVALLCVAIPLRCMQEVIYLIDDGQLVLNGIQISLMAIPGVFVPLYLSVLVEVVMGGSLDCLRFLMWHLYVEDVACPVKELLSSDTHQQNPLKLP